MYTSQQMAKTALLTRTGHRFRIGNVISFAFSNLMRGRSYESLVTLRCESCCRYLIDCTAAVRPKRHSNVANRNALGRRHHLASKRRGRSAEASSQATEAGAARGCPQHRVPSDIANHSNAVGVADVASRAGACKASECHHRQLRRWLRIKPSVRQQTLGGMQRIWWHLFVNVQKRRPLQNLQRMHDGRTGDRLEKQ